jgi:hypothetical protein
MTSDDQRPNPPVAVGNSALWQRDVAHPVGAADPTLGAWGRRGGSFPIREFMPMVLEFLCYRPDAAIPPRDLIEELLA